MANIDAGRQNILPQTQSDHERDFPSKAQRVLLYFQNIWREPSVAYKSINDTSAESHEHTLPSTVTPCHDAPPASSRRFYGLFGAISKMILSNFRTSLSLAIVPVAFVLGLMHGIHPGVTFTMNLLAVFPLSIVLTAATESLASDMGVIPGALLNMSCGNLAEIIILIMTLSHGQVRVVQSSLIGSILVNLLLVLGLSIVIGGIRYKEQGYDTSTTHLFVSLMNLTVFSLVIPTAFYGAFQDTTTADYAAMIFSRAISIALFFVYILYLIFQLKTHSHLFRLTQSSVNNDIEMEDHAVEITREPKPSMVINGHEDITETTSMYDDFPVPTSSESGSAEVPLLEIESTNGDTSDSGLGISARSTNRTNKRIKAVIVLIISTGVLSVCADTIVSSFRALNEDGILRESFVGLIILPIVGNVSEILAASLVASRDKMGLAINIAVGSAIQIGLLMTPLTVIVGWIIQEDMSLHFDMFETATMIITTLIVSFMILRGKTNYFDGAIMLVCFFGITVGAYLLPDQE